MLGDQLRTLRERAGLTQDRLAELLCAELDRPTFTRNDISRYERGSRTPTVPTLRALATVLGADMRNLEAARSGLSVEQVDRLAYSAAHPDRADTATVDALAEMLATHRRLEDLVGAEPVIGAVRSAKVLAEMVAEQAPGRVRPAVVGLVSELHQYLGWLAIPLRRWDDADRELDRAATLGLEVDDSQRTAMALSFKAYLRLRRGDVRGTVAYNLAARRASKPYIGLRTYSTYQAAEVMARDGDHRSARRELAKAEKLTDRLPPPDELPSWGYWYTRPFFDGNRAFVLHALGERQAAREAMADSIAAMPADWQAAEWSERRRALVDA